MNRRFAHVICSQCLHVNYFVRLKSCPACDKPYLRFCNYCQEATETVDEDCVKCGFSKPTPDYLVKGKDDEKELEA